MSDDLIAGAKWTLENAAGMTLEDEEVRQLCDMADRIEELEAKLAKALAALGDVQRFVKDLAPYADQGHTLVPALQRACDVYAELKGETND